MAQFNSHKSHRRDLLSITVWLVALGLLVSVALQLHALDRLPAPAQPHFQLLQTR